MRGSSHKPRERLIASEGGNLTSVLYWLKIRNERAYRKLLRVVQAIEPDLDLINFNTGTSKTGMSIGGPPPMRRTGLCVSWRSPTFSWFSPGLARRRCT